MFSPKTGDQADGDRQNDGGKLGHLAYITYSFMARYHRRLFTVKSIFDKVNLEMNLQFLIIFVKHEVSMKSPLNQNLPAVLHQDGSQNEWGWSKAKLGANAILVPWLPWLCFQSE